jgi:polyisoprenyl-phosphate glycosyltransferase
MVSSIAAQEVPDLSVVVPCFNEAANLGPLMARLLPVLDATGKSFELIFVDDGSRDATLDLARRISFEDSRIGVLALSRNFGKEIAIAAGLDHARGRGVIIIDADLQHPPELIPELVATWEQGFEVVHAAQSIRPDEPVLKRFGVKAFYWLLDNLSETKLPKGVGDFCLLDRRAVDALCSLPERARFMKGLYFWIGFRQAQIPYEPQSRNEGASGWSLTKLLGLALNGLTAFSTIPLRLAAFLGLVVSLVALVYAVILVTDVLLHGVDVPGYASLMVGLLFLSGVQLISLGILGEYIGRIFNESKQRPLYLIQDFRQPRPDRAEPAPLPRLAGE